MHSQCWFLRSEGGNFGEKMVGLNFELRKGLLDERRLNLENFEKFGSAGLVRSKFPAESRFG